MKGRYFHNDSCLILPHREDFVQIFLAEYFRFKADAA